MMLRDTHRIVGEYLLKEEDMRQGRAFDDAITINNMPPDVFGPDDEHSMVNNIPREVLKQYEDSLKK